MMTNEEKAKAYDEAVNKVRPLYEQAIKDGNPVWSTYQYLFPNLYESEDENLKNKSGYYKAGKFWKASTLWNAVKDKTPLRVPNRYILQNCTWNICSLQDFAYEVKNVQEVSLDYPIILDINGNILDGAHRVVKAYLEDKDIDIVYLGDDEWPEPDYDEEKAVKESKDEKIRKELIQYLKDYPCNLPNGLYSRDDFFTYLEKLKEEEEYEAIPVKSTLEYKLGFADGRDSEKQKELSELGKYIADKRSKVGFYCNHKEVSWNEIPLEDRKHDYPYYFDGDIDCYPFVVRKQKEQKPVINNEQQECPYKDLVLVKNFFGEYKRKCKLSNKACDSKECKQWDKLQGEFKNINEAFEDGKKEVIANPEKYGLCKPAEWSEDFDEEDIRTRFAFYTCKDDPSRLYLSNVFVEEASRNHGFGTRILIAAEKVAETIGATTISLKVEQDSPVNKWYHKNGYDYVAFEDGYNWLEKNLEYMKPNKQEWSEEDEHRRKDAIYFLESAKRHYADTSEIEKTIAWLKSLRPSWRPSEWQMSMLLAVINDPNNAGSESCYLTLKSIYEQLKKLM